MKHAEQEQATTETKRSFSGSIEPREPVAHPHYPMRPLQAGPTRVVFVQTADTEDEREEWER